MDPRPVLLLALLLPTSVPELRLGLIEADPFLVAVCSFALQKAHDRGVVKVLQIPTVSDLSVQEPVLLLNASGCAGEGAANAARLFFEERVSGIVASRCPEETLEIARFAYFERIPVLSRVGSLPDLFDNHQNPTLVATPLASVVGYGLAVEALLRHLGFRSVGPSGVGPS
uniref:ANF_receptor domain-containing protein n=1 Tax=Steinernema glaseri TaxID=37863 RepID=A0A1I7Y8J3_9BILA